MSDLQQRIKGWLVNPKRFLSQPSLSRANKLPENIAEVNLNLDSLSCVRKNEISADEITILGFWLIGRDDEVSIEGVILTGSKFKSAGDRFDVNLCIPIIPNAESATFCFMVYEEDAPILLDSHDPIGLVTFHQNAGINVYSGDFRAVDNPRSFAFDFKSGQEAVLGEKGDGCYKLNYHFATVER